MEKHSLKERLRYRFDRVMSRGMISLIGLLFLITLVVVFVTGLGAFLLGEKDQQWTESIWLSLMHALDASALGGDEGSVFYIIIMVVVSICGIFVTSILIGLITTGLEEKFAHLRKGLSNVLENQHTLILGFGDDLFLILNELASAGENKKKSCIVVLGDGSKEEMEDLIRERVDTKHTRIIVRSGDTTNVDDLLRCAIKHSRSIIINENDDFRTIKSILSIVHILKQADANPEAYAVAVLREESSFQAAQIAGEGKVEVLFFASEIAKLIAHSARQASMCDVLRDLLDFEGDEIYFESFDALAGQNMLSIVPRFANAEVIGIEKNGQCTINPNYDVRYELGDRLILVAEDDGVARLLETPPEIDRRAFAQKMRREKPILSKGDVLVLGDNEYLWDMLIELDKFVEKGTKVTVATISTLEQSSKPEFENFELHMNMGCRLMDGRSIEKLLQEDIANIVLLSDHSIQPDEADAKTLVQLLFIQEAMCTKSRTCTITTEMQGAKNEELADNMHVSDFVVGSRVISQMLVQISENRQLSGMFKELLQSEKAELYMKPASQFVRLGYEMDGFTLSAAVYEGGDMLLGIRYKREDGSTDIVLNPPKEQRISFAEQDAVIVAAQDWY